MGSTACMHLAVAMIVDEYVEDVESSSKGDERRARSERAVS